MLQHGIVTTRQMQACGISESAITWRSRQGRLHRIHRGVYAVGHAALSREAHWMAAVLATGEGAVVAGRSAATLWELLRYPVSGTEILVPRRHHGLPGAQVRTTRTLIGSEVTKRNGLPVTTVARTLVDLAGALDAHQLANVMHEASFRRRLDLESLRETMERNRTCRGSSVMARALELHMSGSAGTRSRLEERYLALVRAAGLEEPRVNQRLLIAGVELEVDFCWPHHRLCVEVDGSGHRRPRTRREDAHRDALLRAAGYTVVRCSAEMIELGKPDALDPVIRVLAAGTPATQAALEVQLMGR